MTPTAQEKIDVMDDWLVEQELTPTDTTRRPGVAGIITPTVITPTETYDCTGWVFTCGTAGWLNLIVDLPRILSDNGYAPVTDTHMVHVGAVAVYKGAYGQFTHFGIVREVESDGTRTREYCQYGTPTLVESKWSDGGQYEHPPEEVPDIYAPPDDPETPENERADSIEYYQSPKRTASEDSDDPGKDQHDLLKIR